MAVMARRCISMSCLSNICGQVVTRRTLGKKLVGGLVYSAAPHSGHSSNQRTVHTTRTIMMIQVFFDIVFDQPMELPDEGGGHGQTLRHSLELIAKLVRRSACMQCMHGALISACGPPRNDMHSSV